LSGLSERLDGFDCPLRVAGRFSELGQRLERLGLSGIDLEHRLVDGARPFCGVERAGQHASAFEE
jgi:hypothetical protein